VLTARSNDQRQKIKLMFKTMFGKVRLLDAFSVINSDILQHYVQFFSYLLLVSLHIFATASLPIETYNL